MSDEFKIEEFCPLRRAGQELDDLVTKWFRSLMDDRLTYGEIIQILEYKKLALFLEAEKVVGNLPEV